MIIWKVESEISNCYLNETKSCSIEEFDTPFENLF
jgi:hypothetical protein